MTVFDREGLEFDAKTDAKLRNRVNIINDRHGLIVDPERFLSSMALICDITRQWWKWDSGTDAVPASHINRKIDSLKNAINRLDDPTLTTLEARAGKDVFEPLLAVLEGIPADGKDHTRQAFGCAVRQEFERLNIPWTVSDGSMAVSVIEVLTDYLRLPYNPRLTAVDARI